MILRVKFPSDNFCKSSGCWSMGTTSCILSMNPDQSPIPYGKKETVCQSNQTVTAKIYRINKYKIRGWGTYPRGG
jgi:hypothetical protein